MSRFFLTLFYLFPPALESRGHECAEAAETIGINDTGSFDMTTTAAFLPVGLTLCRLLPVDLLELEDVIDGQEFRRVAAIGGPQGFRFSFVFDGKKR